MIPNLVALVSEWQTALRLLDWRITAELVPDLCAGDGSPVYGLCSRLVDNKTARLQIRDPRTPIPGGRPSDDIEEIVIHELLHLHFAPFETRAPAEVAAEEQAVWAIAEAIAKQKGTGREYQIARSMLAHLRTSAATATKKAAVTGRKERRMDPQLLAMLKSVLASKDPAAGLDALVKELEGAGSGDAAPPSGDPPAPAAAAAPPKAPDDQQPCARPARAESLARTPAAPPIAVDGATVMRMVTGAVNEGIDGFKRDQLLVAEGSRLGDEDLRWARTQPYEVVRRMIGVAPPASAEPAATVGKQPSQRAARGTAPARPAHTPAATSAGDALVDRAMRVAQPDEQVVSIDQTTGRLSISLAKPITVKPGGESAGAARS